MAEKLPTKPLRSLPRRLVTLIAGVLTVAVAAYSFYLVWRVRQIEPIRESIAMHSFPGASDVVRQSDGSYRLINLFGDEQTLAVRDVGSVGFFRAEAEGEITRRSSSGGFSSNDMHYRLRRTDGRWKVEEATVTLFGCGVTARSGYPAKVWAGTDQLIDLLNGTDVTKRQRASATLAGLALQALRRDVDRPEIAKIVEALAAAEHDADPVIRANARRLLEAASQRPSVVSP